MAASAGAGAASVSDTRGSDAEHSHNKQTQTDSDALEDALELLGPFGLYQRYMLVMLCLPNILAAMYSLNYVFVADQVPFRYYKAGKSYKLPIEEKINMAMTYNEFRMKDFNARYRCVVPECEGPTGAHFSNETALGLLPNATCLRYAPLDGHDNHTCERQDFHHRDTIDCEQFVYETQETIFAEFNLGCREWMRTMVGTVRNSALPFALILTGYVSDSFGRRTAFCVFSSFAAVLGIVKGFSVNYQMYLAMEFFEAMLGYGFNSAGYVMLVELARPSVRAAFACATGVAYGAGGALFAWLASHVRYWRHLLWAAHSAALLLPLYWLLVDESWRWLHARGRTEDTATIIRKAARWNKVILDEDVMARLTESGHLKKKVGPQANPWLGLVRSRVLMWRFAVCAWCWVAAAFVYYGLTINSVALSGDKYVNFALNMVMEIVASLLLMMALERIGRKWSIFSSFLLCGMACVAPFYISHEGTGLGLFFVGKLAITFAFNSMYVFTAELFPTRARSSALAACSLVGRIGSILAPQTPLLSWSVQAMLYGGSSAAAALAVLLAPETRRARLPADVAAAERMGAATPAAPAAPAAPAPPPRVLSADS